jgi:hypothetical protein
LFAVCSGLRQSLKAAEETRTQLECELNAAKLKNGKLLVKVKTVTKELEALKKKRPSPESFDDLDRALQEEMNNQVAKVGISKKYTIVLFSLRAQIKDKIQDYEG